MSEGANYISNSKTVAMVGLSELILGLRKLILCEGANSNPTMVWISLSLLGCRIFQNVCWGANLGPL